jgi:hypothetical protein
MTDTHAALFGLACLFIGIAIGAMLGHELRRLWQKPAPLSREERRERAEAHVSEQARAVSEFILADAVRQLGDRAFDIKIPSDGVSWTLSDIRSGERWRVDQAPDGSLRFLRVP